MVGWPLITAESIDSAGGISINGGLLGPGNMGAVKKMK